MDGCPSQQQSQRLMQQATSLREFYFLLAECEEARADYWDSEKAQQRESAIAKEVAAPFMKPARCILEWHSTYIKNDAPDGRGKHERDYLLSNEDLRLQFVV